MVGALLSSSKGPSLNHRAEVPPIFLAYRWVYAEGQKLPLVQVATSIIQAMGTHVKLDAIQLMRTGWNIYMHTLLDHTQLIEKGIHLTGKFVLLCSESQAGAQWSVKVMIKDLPLHSVGNEDMLEEVKKVCKVTSIVHYANLWYNG